MAEQGILRAREARGRGVSEEKTVQQEDGIGRRVIAVENQEIERDGSTCIHGRDGCTKIRHSLHRRARQEGPACRTCIRRPG